MAILLNTNNKGVAMTKARSMIEPAGNQNSIALRNFPIEGMGKRVMDCEMYDKCLYRAAIKNWESFNCDGCKYKGQVSFSFIDSVFIPEFEELDLMFENDLEMERVDLYTYFTSISF
jgi:hypothetical protein